MLKDLPESGEVVANLTMLRGGGLIDLHGLKVGPSTLPLHTLRHISPLTSATKVDTKCTTPSLIPTVNGNTVLYARTTVRSPRKLNHCLTL